MLCSKCDFVHCPPKAISSPPLPPPPLMLCWAAELILLEPEQVERGRRGTCPTCVQCLHVEAWVHLELQQLSPPSSCKTSQAKKTH